STVGVGASDLPFDLEFIYRAFRTDMGLKSVNIPGDRLLSRLATNLSQFLGSPVSDQGREAFEEFKSTFSMEIFSRNLRSLARFSPQQIVDFVSVDGNALMQRMVQARNHQDWERVIEIYDQELNEVWRSLPEARLQMALALNRRNGPAQGEFAADRERALELVKVVFSQNPGRAILSEAAGIKGRIYKDLFAETGNRLFLDAALSSYRYGFEANPSDYYPGVAYLDLLFGVGDRESVDLAIDYSERVAYSIQGARARLESQGKPLDYWLLGSQMQVAIIQGDWDTVRDTFPDVVANAAGPVNLQTSLEGHQRKRETLAALGYPQDVIDQLDRIIFAYQSKIEDPNGVGTLTPMSLSYVSPVSFQKTEGIFSADSFYVKKEIERSEVEEDLQKAAAQHGISIRSFHKFLQANTAENSKGGVILAPTGPYDAVIRTLAETTGMRSWHQAYE
ncbi:MAG: TRAFs-binding domain-containing protein, partial [Pseudomonadota bacterium]